jgi:hypothetical protein
MRCEACEGSSEMALVLSPEEAEALGLHSLGGGRKRPDVLRNVLLIARTSEDTIQETVAGFSSSSTASQEVILGPRRHSHPTASSLLPLYVLPRRHDATLL